MFNKNNIEKLNKDKEVVEKINQDFLVRNMPSLQNFNRIPVSGAHLESGGELLSGLEKPKHNFKAVGVFIIFGGLALIGGLIYASYVFIIKPQTSTEPITTATQPSQNSSSIVDTINANRETEVNEETKITDTNFVATTTPVIVDLATSSASSTIESDAINTQTTVAAIIDTDNDGLNNDEEGILGTNPEMVDSNSNGYADLVEINNGYDPAISGKLNSNPNLAQYLNQTFNYGILYPKVWKVSALDNNASVIFTAPDNSIVQISVQENSDGQGILGWYGNMFPTEALTYDKLKSTDSWEGIWGSDNVNFYLTDRARENIYVVSFISPVDGRVAYPNIYNLMINSLMIN